jgi:16S rRNA (cytosine1407-C5)-methyltransferase
MAKKKRPQSAPSARQAQAEALERFRPLLDEPGFSALLRELQQPLYPALRINPLKTTGEDVGRMAARYGWELSPVPFCPTGWWVTAARTPISQTLEHRMGHYYIQDAASMLPVELFDLSPDERPLIRRTLDRGLVIANDSGVDRTTALRLVLQTWGAINVAATRFPGERFGRWFPETFDRVLLDAPCSMQSLRSTETHPMRVISAREQSGLARRQVNLLASAFAAVKIGGQVVYSTCTLAPEENEAVLEELLRRYPGSFTVEALDERLPAPAPALASAFGQPFLPEVARAARLWPHIFHTSGFFAALLRKTSPLPLPAEAPPSRSLETVGQQPLSAGQSQRFQREFLDRYGFDLSGVLESQRLALWRSERAVYAVPLAFLERFADLPCQLLGLKIAEGEPDNWLPSHEWTARFGPRLSRGRVSLPAESLNAWLRGEDLPWTSGAESVGQVVAAFDPDGRFVGRAKVTRGLLKNLLPRRLV